MERRLGAGGWDQKRYALLEIENVFVDVRVERGANLAA
jgi:hypothetical protein